jgi:hypothetical protein
MAANNPNGSVEELVADFKIILNHFTGKTASVSVSSESVIFKLGDKESLSVSWQQAKSNCGLTCVHGAQVFAGFLQSNPLKIGKEENMIILDFIMTIVEKAIYVAKKTNIVNWSFAYPNNECQLYVEFLERRKKLGVKLQYINTDFANKNSGNKQVVSDTLVTNDDIPLVFNMTIVNALTSKRVIDLSKFDAFKPFWSKWSENSFFNCSEGMMQFESCSGNKVTFVVVDAINEDHIGKIITRTYTDTDNVLPTLNKVEQAALVDSIAAERIKQSVKIKGERIFKRYNDIISKKTVDASDATTTFVDNMVYGYITTYGTWGSNCYIYNTEKNEFFTQNGGSAELRAFKGRLVPLFSANDIK